MRYLTISTYLMKDCNDICLRAHHLVTYDITPCLEESYSLATPTLAQLPCFNFLAKRSHTNHRQYPTPTPPGALRVRIDHRNFAVCFAAHLLNPSAPP